MSAIKYTEALEIMNPEVAVLDEPAKSLLKKLIAENIKLKAELEYHEKYMLSGDGKRCDVCEAVRHIDDMIIPSDESYDLEGVCCCQKCADKFVEEARSKREVEQDIDYLWRNR